MHEISGVAECTVALGAEVCCRPVRVRRDPKRAGVVRRAFQWLASGPVVTGRQIEALLGHYISVTLFRRAGLSVLRALYPFIRDRYWVSCRLWDSCRCERWIISALIPLLSTRVDLPFCREVVASDASPSGIGVCESTWADEDVQRVASWQEPWRFRRLDPSEWKHRKRALEDWSEIDDLRTAVEEGESEAHGWRLREGFPEVPPRLLRPDSCSMARCSSMSRSLC